MKSYDHDNIRLPRGVVLRVSTLVLAGILCSYPYWSPSVVNFLFAKVPRAKTSLLAPECLFLLLNAIIAFLIGESRLVGSNKSVPRSKDIYEEYVEERREILRRVPSFPDGGENIKVEDHVGGSVREDKQTGTGSGVSEAGEPKHEEGGDGDEDGDLGAEELNKRVEEFIAMVNHQRLMEARDL